MVGFASLLVQRIHPSANRWDERSGRCRRKAKKGSHDEVHGQLWKLGNIMTGILRCSVPPCFCHPSSMDFLVLKGREGISDTVANKLDFTVVPTVRETGRLTIPFRRVPGRTPQRHLLEDASSGKVSDNGRLHDGWFLV